MGGIGAGSPEINGITIAGFGVGGENITGISAAIGTVKIENEGLYKGLAISAFNYIKGEQNGVSIGIVNYSHKLTGFQFGLINYVRDNPAWMRILPLVNFHF